MPVANSVSQSSCGAAMSGPQTSHETRSDEEILEAVHFEAELASILIARLSTRRPAVKRYRTIVRRDAWINYVAEIEASSPQEAAEIALREWRSDKPKIKFVEDGVSEFDHVECDPDDCELIRGGRSFLLVLHGWRK